LLLRTFAIPTGEDPDKISSAEIDSKIAAEIPEKITPTMVEALRQMITNHKIPNEEVIEVLGNFGYKKLNEIKLNDYKEFVTALTGE
jgi:hypothetical protein